MGDGEHICVQLLDRPQKLLKVVVIALDSFTSDRDKAPLFALHAVGGVYQCLD